MSKLKICVSVLLMFIIPAFAFTSCDLLESAGEEDEEVTIEEKCETACKKIDSCNLLTSIGFDSYSDCIGDCEDNKPTTSDFNCISNNGCADIVTVCFSDDSGFSGSSSSSSSSSGASSSTGTIPEVTDCESACGKINACGIFSVAEITFSQCLETCSYPGGMNSDDVSCVAETGCDSIMDECLTEKYCTESCFFECVNGSCEEVCEIVCEDVSPEDQCNPGCFPDWKGDGLCDEDCNVEACEFDGGDCEK